jgi:hypothetical protein
MSGDRVQRRLDLLVAERKRRHAARFTAADDDPRGWLIAKLDEMGERPAGGPRLHRALARGSRRGARDRSIFG